MSCAARLVEGLLQYELDALCALAARVINEHLNDQGSCRACGASFPCPLACLADQNLQVCAREP
jgi:hypothetical protein